MINLKKILKKQELLGFLIDNFEYSNKKTKALLKNGLVSVDDKVITQYNYLLKEGQVVKIDKYNKSKEIKIIYEDKNIIVVDKPYNLLTISDGKSNNTLYNLVSDYIKKNNKNNKIFIIHRLDKDTSGLVIFAKNEKIKKLYQKNWFKFERKYIAIVVGKTKDKDTLKNYLKENSNHFVYVSDQGDLAITEYKKIKSNGKYTWLDINIQTGKKNQIRVQLAYNKTPILGDIKYGNNKYKRLCLHAYELVIIDPLTNKKLIFKSDINDF